MALEAEPTTGRDFAWRGEVERIFQAFQPRLFSLALRMTWNRDEALDLVQEAFLRLARAGDRALRGTEAEAWLMRVVVNLCNDARRRARVRAHARGELGAPTSEAGGATLRVELREALGRLAPRRRAILLLHDLEGRTASEIAEILGSTAVTVRWHLHRARKSIRESLGGRGRRDAC